MPAPHPTMQKSHERPRHSIAHSALAAVFDRKTTLKSGQGDYMTGTPILRLICASSLVAPVFAQSAGTPGDAAVADDTTGLQEVVVTAQRRSENQQRIPVAVSAVTADQLQ